MEPAAPRLDFQRIHNALRRASAFTEAAESHGMLCGMLCATGRVDARTWIGQVMGEKDTGDVLAGECRDLLSALYDRTVRQLNDADLDFHLLLPDDEQLLSARAEALGEWCQGFLYGLGLGGMRPDDELPGDVREILRDLGEISKVQSEIRETGEEEEAAYAEIVEYVRMSVLLINEDLNPLKAPPRLM